MPHYDIETASSKANNTKPIVGGVISLCIGEMQMMQKAVSFNVVPKVTRDWSGMPLYGLLRDLASPSEL
eukprot:scaffold345845_cov19-Prasinocladus_malaysianus.AAC.1